jgi:uridine kinase
MSSLIPPIISKIKQLARTREVVLVAIDGVGGSGKTTLAEMIQRGLKDCVIIELDDFYSPKLGAADLLRLKEQILSPLQDGREAKFQIFEWKTDSLSEWHILKPEGIFIFEGVYALDKSVRDYYHLRIWIDYPSDLGFRRGIARDIARDGVDNSEKWKNIWMPLEEKYQNEQSPKLSADFIIDGKKLPG